MFKIPASSSSHASSCYPPPKYVKNQSESVQRMNGHLVELIIFGFLVGLFASLLGFQVGQWQWWTIVFVLCTAIVVVIRRADKKHE